MQPKTGQSILDGSYCQPDPHTGVGGSGREEKKSRRGAIWSGFYRIAKISPNSHKSSAQLLTLQFLPQLNKQIIIWNLYHRYNIHQKEKKKKSIAAFNAPGVRRSPRYTVKRKKLRYTTVYVTYATMSKKTQHVCIICLCMHGTPQKDT